MELILLALLTFVAAMIGTVTGFGTSTIMVPVLLFFFPLPIVLLFVGIIHWFGDIWKLLLFREGIRWRLVLQFGLPAVIMSFVGAAVILQLPEVLLLRILGGSLVAYSLYVILIHHRLTIQPRRATAMVGGGLSGFFIGLLGFGGEIRSMFLSAFNLPKGVYLATIGAIAFATDITRLATYLVNGTRLSSTLMMSLIVLIPVSFLGAKAAQLVVRKIPEDRFRILILAFLFVIGLKLLIIP